MLVGSFFEELQPRGYQGCETTLRNFVAHLHKDFPWMVHLPKKTAEGHLSVSSLREILWLLVRRKEDLEPKECANLIRLLEQSLEAKLLH
jgi:hypothetical protein